MRHIDRMLDHGERVIQRRPIAGNDRLEIEIHIAWSDSGKFQCHWFGRDIGLMRGMRCRRWSTGFNFTPVFLTESEAVDSALEQIRAALKYLEDKKGN
jgi:hypothetical protein